MEPIVSRPHMPGYGVLGPAEGTGLLPWAWAREHLVRSRDYWLATVRPDERPHLTPVWGVWQQEMLWFSCSRASRKARNLFSNRSVVASTMDSTEPVTIEGLARPVEEPASIAAFAAWSDAKYRTSYGVDFYADPANVCFCIEVVEAFGLTCEDFVGSPTRWTFRQ